MLAQQARIKAEIADPPPDTGTLVRVSFPPTRLAGTLTLIRAAASRQRGRCRDRGIGRAPASSTSRFRPRRRRRRWPGSSPRCGRNWAGSSGAATAVRPARAVVVYAPDEVRELTDAHGPVPSLALLRAVKDEFDPEHRMAPGRLADAV